MAILDAQQEFCDAQALTATADSTNYIDFRADRNIGIGQPMVVELVLDVAASDTNGNETYTAILETDDNTSFNSATQVGATVTITRGDAAGTRYFIPIPPNADMERYAQLAFTLGGSDPTVTVTAHLKSMNEVQNDFVYPNGYTIS